MKAYTDIEQSKRLAEILPLESADMYYYTVNGDIYKTPNMIERIDDLDVDDKSIPCWSLAALLELIPNYVINKVDDKIYSNLYYSFKSSHDNLVDAAFEMIRELYEL